MRVSRCLTAILFVLGWCFGPHSYAQSPRSSVDERDAIVQLLADRGLENVAAAITGQTLIVTYENRRYRYDLRALQEVLTVLSNETSRDSIVVIPRQQNLALSAVSIDRETLRAYASAEADTSAFRSALRVSFAPSEYEAHVRGLSRANRTDGRIDALINPSIAVRFGNFSDALETQINLIPELQARLWYGAAARLQVILPIQNELSSEGNYVRPGLLVLNQTVRLPRNVFAAVSAGYFTENRYGVDVGARWYRLNGRLRLGGDAGLTGFLSYRDRTWLYDPINLWTPRLTASYRIWPAYDLVIRATYGRFLYQDTGFRFDVTRSFGEVRLMLYGLIGEGSDNLGFAISVPFFGGRYARPARFRLRPPRTFGQEYRFKNAPLDGIWYQTGFDLDRFDHQINPDFIRNHLPELSRWRSE